MESKNKQNDNEASDEETQDTKNYATLNDNDMPIEVNSKDLEYITSAKTWMDLQIPDKLYEQLVKLSFRKPSRIQAMVIKLSKTNNVVAQSQNGSGKTLSFLIPSILNVNSNESCKGEDGKAKPQVIILADTSALIQQHMKTCRRQIEGVYDIKVGGMFSGVNDLGHYPHIFICTIASLKNLLNNQKKGVAVDISNVKLLVVDECDVIMASDTASRFLPPQVIRMLPKTTKLILTSATQTEVSKKFIEKLELGQKKIPRIELPVEQLTLKNVKQCYFDCSRNETFGLLDKLFNKINASNILIFDNSKKRLISLEKHLTNQGHKVTCVMSNSEDKANQAELNQKNIELFLQGKYRVLLTTNLQARGIDMRKVQLVINQELPRKFLERGEEKNQPIQVDVETYQHRVGRTGRFGDHGIAINFITDDTQKKMQNDIMSHYKNNIEQIKDNDFNEIEKALGEISEYNVAKREKLEENI